MNLNKSQNSYDPSMELHSKKLELVLSMVIKTLFLYKNNLDLG